MLAFYPRHTPMKSIFVVAWPEYEASSLHDISKPSGVIHKHLQ